MMSSTAPGQCDGQHDEAAADVAHHGHGAFRQAGDGRDADRQHQCRDDIRQSFDDAEVLQLVLAGVLQQVVKAADEDALDDPVGQPGGEDQRGAGEQRLQFGVGS